MPKNQREETEPGMKRKQYEEELRKLQMELCRLQERVVHPGACVIVVLEGSLAGSRWIGKGWPPNRSARLGVACPFQRPADRLPAISQHLTDLSEFKDLRQKG